MSRTPNPEQNLAITHQGPVLLSAGAGSGKTFVIVERIIFIISNFKKNNPSNSEAEIVSFLSSIVLVTFTKKAAGEMYVRLIARVESCIEEDDFWKIILKNIGMIQISTIHSFCQKLIASGVWPNLPTKVEIVSDFINQDKIKRLCHQWFEKNSNQLNDLFLSHFNELTNAMVEIFNSPELRIIWEGDYKKNSLKEEVDLFLSSVLSDLNLEYVFKRNVIVLDKEKSKKQAYVILNQFEELSNSLGVLSFENLKEYINFFASIKTFPRNLKDMSFEEERLRLELKKLNEVLKKTSTDLLAMIENYPRFLEWENFLSDIFKHVNENYLSINGMSFSDLEYYVYKGLQDVEKREVISSRFKYFIVDEFQDTSFVQFEIITNLLNNNFQNLFCVGDKKQAIYGFRGGELKVFEDCSRLLGENNNLKLSNNYRSEKKVIDFNNAFFENIFPLGIGFEDKDYHSVKMEGQNAVTETKEGSVRVVKYNYEGETDDLDWIEAKGILELLKMDLMNENIHSIAILYRKMKPSKHLVELLKQEGLDFVAQVKISLAEDPIFNLFKYAVNFILNFEDLKKRQSSFFLFNSILSAVVGVGISENILIEFKKNYEIIGLNLAFWKMLAEVGVSNSLVKNNAKLIEDIYVIANGDILKVAAKVNQQDTDYSFELITSDHKKIHILSTHGSKGLEYDSVIVGGIYTNGKFEGLKNKIGNLPRSFRWKKDFNQKIYYKSPQFFVEAELVKQKDFSESKRLLYVANTRAAKKLSIIELTKNGQLVEVSGNSWRNAFQFAPFENAEVFEINSNHPYLDLTKASLILKDNVGIEYNQDGNKLGIVSELSVTRLATIAECPFKFYLKNICKIEPVSKVVPTLDADEVEETFVSSKDRGTKIHYQISKMLTENILNENEKEILQWVKEQIEKIHYHYFESEKEIKFSFFGNMITAIPDLIFFKDQEIEIWDFKTGAYQDYKNLSYNFQLKTYAYGISKIYNLSREYKYILKTVYVDQQLINEQVFNIEQIQQDLFLEWSKAESLTQVNIDHCKNCEYSSMCKFSL